MKKLTINEITTKCNKIHENKYTYDFSKLINDINVTISITLF